MGILALKDFTPHAVLTPIPLRPDTPALAALRRWPAWLSVSAGRPRQASLTSQAAGTRPDGEYGPTRGPRLETCPAEQRIGGSAETTLAARAGDKNHRRLPGSHVAPMMFVLSGVLFWLFAGSR